MDFGGLREKIKRTFSEGGILEVAKRTKNYLAFKAKTGIKKDEMRDILFVNGCVLSHPERYRVDHQMEQLESVGLTVEKVLYTEVKPERLKFYRAIIIFRCPITSEVRGLIEKAHYFNKKVFFDVDDLVIDTKYTDKIKYVQKMTAEERGVYDDGVRRMGETMKLCDYCITTTSALKRELEKYGKEVFINRNVVNEEMVKLSLEAREKVERSDDKIRIGYLSGSITHNLDFLMIKPALVRIMDEFPEVELMVMGYLNIPEMKKFKDRIVRKRFKDWRKLPQVIAGLDINLAPIEETIFNEAKSENKWTEAALCSVPTVASDFGAFREVILDGETGMLCGNVNEWYEKIKKLILDKKLRREIGERANQEVKKKYVTTYSGRGLVEFIESKLARNIGFVLPSTNISGGVNVVFKHCDILRRSGWDVVVLNMDTSDDNVMSEDGEINVVSVVKHDILAKFYSLVATLYTTVRFIREYPKVKNRDYLVQNFETDFNEYGSPVKREANATYNLEGVKYLTISKWCRKWLKEDYGKKAEFARNGIDLVRFKFKERKFGKKIRILIEGNSSDYYKNVDESFRIVEKLDPERFEIWYLSYQGGAKKWYRVDKFYHRVSHDEVGKIYEKCDILLKSSILESFSYPPLEMMATGGFVVVRPNEGNAEYLKDGENCLFYEQWNIEEAILKIGQIVSDEKLRAKLAKNGRKTAEERDWVKVEKEVLRLYE